MEIDFSERREWVPSTADAAGFWHRIYTGSFRHDGQSYFVTLDRADEDSTPEQRLAIEEMLRRMAMHLISTPPILA